MSGRPKPLGERLIDLGILTRAQLDLALKMQSRTGEMVGEILVSLGFVSEEILASALAAQSNVKQIDLRTVMVEEEALSLVPEALARKHHLLPVNLEDDVLTVAMENVFDVDVLSLLEERTGKLISVVAATEGDIRGALELYYTGGASLDELIEESIQLAQGGGKAGEALVEEAPIVKLVNQFVVKGVRDGATDIHIEPDQKVLRVRYRVDGIMQLGPSIPKPLQNPVVARLKILAGANIAETRVPQDGRIKFVVGRRDIDIRVSFFPSIHGENVVLRLLDKGKLVMGLDKLGMMNDHVQQFQKAIERPYGMVLVSGPTGSGKTTSLYSALSYLNSIEKTIVTLEDPVEYEFPVICQAQVNPRIQFTFAEGLRAILRQDPDIILVGEMRDGETIDMSIRAALTGHLVFSTIHTNNAVSTISRLLDMGVEPFLIASTLILVVSQRLVRKVCDHCKEPVVGDAIFSQPYRDWWEAHDRPLMAGRGCEKCRNTGYRGRVGVFEVLAMTSPMRDLIERRATSQEMAEQARRDGMRSLFEDALLKVEAGLTTLDEAIRVTMGVF